MWAQEPPPLLDLAPIPTPHTSVPGNEELPVSAWASVLPLLCGRLFHQEIVWQGLLAFVLHS